MLVPDSIEDVIATAGADEYAWRRARGWALHFALMYVANADDAPVMRNIGLRLLEDLGVGVR